MFRGKRTTIFYVGLVAVGFGLYYLVQFLFSVGAFALTYLITLSGSTINPQIFTSMLIAFVPTLCGAIIFLAIGLYTMSRGTENVASNQALAP